MRKTVVRCSMPGCGEEAVSKVAVPWHYGPIEELKTYGYSCSPHVDAVVSFARSRLDLAHLDSEESIDEIVTIALLGH